jgi:hypothetical protein
MEKPFSVMLALFVVSFVMYSFMSFIVHIAPTEPLCISNCTNASCDSRCLSIAGIEFLGDVNTAREKNPTAYALCCKEPVCNTTCSYQDISIREILWGIACAVMVITGSSMLVPFPSSWYYQNNNGLLTEFEKNRLAGISENQRANEERLQNALIDEKNKRIKKDVK